MVTRVGNRLYWAIAVAVSLIVGIASTFFLGPDNRIEEIAEAVIHYITGFDPDISEGKE